MPWPSGRSGVEKSDSWLERVGAAARPRLNRSAPGDASYRSPGSRFRVSGFGFPENQSRWAPGQARGDEIGFDIRDDGEQGGFRGSGFRKIKVAGPRVKPGATKLGLTFGMTGNKADFGVRVSGKSKSLGPGSSPGRRYRSWAFRRTFFRSGGAGVDKDRFPGFRVRVSGKSKSLGPGSSPGRRNWV